MAYKLTLIEYDQNIFDGDDMIPDISYRDYVTGILGAKEITEAEQADVDLIEVQQRIEDMRVYAKVISSSSSSSSSFSSSVSSSSSSSSEIGGYEFKDLNVSYCSNGIYISPDGYHLLTIDYWSSSYGIKSYYMSTPWDINTLSYVAGVKFEDIPNVVEAYFHGIYAHPDGQHIYVAGSTSSYYTTIYDITIDTAWDITDNPTRNDYHTTNTYWYYHHDLRFSADGTKFYLADDYSDLVAQYNMSSAWDISTAGSSASQSTDISSYDDECKGVCFKSDGTKMLVVGGQHDKVYYWTLSSAWNLSGESKDEYEFDISEVVTEPHGIFCKPDIGHVFIILSNGYLYDFEVP